MPKLRVVEARICRGSGGFGRGVCSLLVLVSAGMSAVSGVWFAWRTESVSIAESGGQSFGNCILERTSPCLYLRNDRPVVRR